MNWSGPAHRLQFLQPGQFGRRPVALVALQRDLLLGDLPGRLVLHRLRHRDRHDLRIEPPRLLRRSGPLLALQRERILRGAGDAVAGGDDIRRLDHREVEIGPVLLQPCFGRGPIGRLHHRDALHPADEHRLRPLRRDHVTAHRDGLQPAGAEAVHRRPRDAVGQARAQHDLTRDVAAGDVFRVAAAPDAVLDQRGVDPRTLHRRGRDVTAHDGPVGPVERAPPGLADGGARGGDDDGLAHGQSFLGAFKSAKLRPSETRRSSRGAGFQKWSSSEANVRMSARMLSSPRASAQCIGPPLYRGNP